MATHMPSLWQPSGGVAPWWMYTWPGVSLRGTRGGLASLAPHSARLTMRGQLAARERGDAAVTEWNADRQIDPDTD